VQHTVGSGREINESVINIKRELDDESQNFNTGVRGMSSTMALSIKSMTNNTFGNNTEGLDCVVCGDRATGKKKENIEILFFKI